ncbi:MAG: hypothetical protein AAGA66_19960, partial [Bacteroidota bacterium]
CALLRWQYGEAARGTDHPNGSLELMMSQKSNFVMDANKLDTGVITLEGLTLIKKWEWVSLDLLCLNDPKVSTNLPRIENLEIKRNNNKRLVNTLMKKMTFKDIVGYACIGLLQEIIGSTNKNEI